MSLATAHPNDVPAVRFRGVAKRFAGDRRVFDRLNIDVPRTGVTFVVGRSGAGKSVLCRLAVGLERPEAGTIELFGTAIERLPERRILALRARAPYLVQGPTLLDWLTVAQNVALAEPHRDAARVRRALERVGLLEVADRLPTQLGPGVRKRAAIARALVLEPGYLVLDEPTTGLDKASARQVTQVMGSLRGEGLGAMVVSHDYPLLERIADRVILVGDGQARLFESARAFLGSDDVEVRALLAPVRAELGRHG